MAQYSTFLESAIANMRMQRGTRCRWACVTTLTFCVVQSKGATCIPRFRHCLLPSTPFHFCCCCVVVLHGTGKGGLRLARVGLDQDTVQPVHGRLGIGGPSSVVQERALDSVEQTAVHDRDLGLRCCWAWEGLLCKCNYAFFSATRGSRLHRRDGGKGGED